MGPLGLSALIPRYPRAWRQRYQDEFTDLMAALSGEHPSRSSRRRLAADIIRGAFDADLHRRSTMNVRRYTREPALRRAVVDGAAHRRRDHRRARTVQCGVPRKAQRQ